MTDYIDLNLEAQDIKLKLVDNGDGTFSPLMATTGDITISGVNVDSVSITSIAAGDNNIGNVDIVTLPELPAGTNSIGGTKDSGPQQTITRTFTTSTNMTTAAALTASPTAGQKITISDIILSTNTNMLFDLEMETSGNVLAAFYIPSGATLQVTPRGYLKADAADKKIYGKADVAGTIKATLVYFSEA